jgi:hypothetical protein
MVRLPHTHPVPGRHESGNIAASDPLEVLKVLRTRVCVRLSFLLFLVLVAPESAPARVDAVAEPWLSHGDESGWLSGAQRGLVEREYEASENGEGLQAPNRRHNLRTYFEASGIRVRDRTAPERPDLLGLSLVGVGRGELLAPVTPGEVVAEGARIEIRRPSLVEWYVNSPAGLEQGFTLLERPKGKGALHLELAVEGARASLRGDRVIFAASAGRRLAYGKLAVVDATGRQLSAHFEVTNPGRLRIALEDRFATYPVIVDPLLTETEDTALESSQSDSALGVSVSGAGDVNGDGYADVIVGADHYDAGQVDEGAAFIFLGSALGIADGGPATAATQLESNQGGANLGVSVSGAGDVNGDGYSDVIVGASQYSSGQNLEGAAFIFHGGASGIPNGGPVIAATQLESNQLGANLGVSVSGAGDVNGDGYADVIVGSGKYTNGQANEGAAFVFHGGVLGVADGNPVTAATQLESNQASANLGVSVSGAGDVDGDGYADVIVGSDQYNAGQAGEGAAFIFMGRALGIADADPSTAATQLESNEVSANLGSSVSSAGDVNGDGYSDVIVGAPVYGFLPYGAAFIFLGSSSGIADGNPVSAATQLLSDQQPSAMGTVSGAGDVNGDGYADVIVGAPGYGFSGNGAAFVFLGSSSGIPDGGPATAYAQLLSDESGANLGAQVAGAGDVNGDGYADVIAGAPIHGFPDAGAAFIYLGGATGIANGNPSNSATLLESDQADALLGYSVSGAGDVNADGYSDVIVGAAWYDAGQSDEGAAFVFLGSAAGIADGTPANAAAQLESDQVDANLGYSVSGAGDVNGDGYADVIAGAPFYDAGQNDEGAAFVFLGSASGIADGNPATASAQFESDQADANLGYTVSDSGDVDGDGFADVIVGAYRYNAGENNEGAAFVFHGGSSGVADGTPASAAAQLESDQAEALLGSSVSGAGDVNGDGYADVIIGAPSFDAGEGTGEGAAFVFHGSALGIANGSPANAAAQLESDQADANLGWSVSGAGDVNADGYADVIAGAHLYDAGRSNEGAAFVFLGSASGIADGDPATAAAQLESNQADANLGYSVSGAGDVNGDGYADVIVGAHLHNAGNIDEGSAFVFLGAASGMADGNPANADAQLQSNRASANLGFSVAGAGDVNGDGYADVIVGAPFYTKGQSDEGVAFVYLGNGGGDARAVVAQQLRGDGSEIPVEPWGGSYEVESFAVRVQATNPEGRGRVKLEVESCEAGLVFGDASCASQTGASWTDVTATSGGVSLTETIGGLVEGDLYRWRARILYAPYSVTETGITPPPNPAHGPWWRVSAQATEADIRVVPEPAAGLSLAAGLMLLALLGRRR